MALAYDGAIQRLIDAFGRLPGIGPKGAQRIAFYMLSAPEDEAVSYTHLDVYKRQPSKGSSARTKSRSR